MRVRMKTAAVVSATRGRTSLLLEQFREQYLQVAVRLRHAPETGASTAEYAMTMLAACAFAGVLLTIIRSSPIKTLLLGIIQKAMNLT